MYIQNMSKTKKFNIIEIITGKYNLIAGVLEGGNNSGLYSFARNTFKTAE
jgi:hypothetical protein